MNSQAGTPPDKTSVYSQDLAVIAPACHGLLKRTLNRDDLKIVEELFKQVAKEEGLENSFTRREIGVSFNPFPARIIQLLITEGGIRDKESILIALLSCCSSHPISNLSPELISASDKIISFLESTQELPILERGEREIAFCHILDRLRHLHMSTLSLNERTAMLQKLTIKIKALEVTLNNRMNSMLNFSYQSAQRLICGSSDE